MEGNIKERIMAWAESGGDFQSGLSLFLSFNRNVFYVRNIEAKGPERGMVTLVSEFSNKTKLPLRDLFEMIQTGATSGAIDERKTLTADPVLGFNSGSEIMTIPTQHPYHLEKRTIKLREEFPFLKSKECPPEFAIVVHKMLTAYEDYCSIREKLYDVDFQDLQQCYLSAREVLDAYILNRQCWEELNHYKLNGSVKGIMPELAQKRMVQEYGAISTVSLVRMINNSIPRRMSYYKKQIADPATKNLDEIRAKKADAESEMEVIRTILISRGEV